MCLIVSRGATLFQTGLSTSSNVSKGQKRFLQVYTSSLIQKNKETQVGDEVVDKVGDEGKDEQHFWLCPS